MSISLGPSQYGKAEVRVVRIHREQPRHELRDLNVSTSLRGHFAAAHLDGDQSSVLPTDTQKNTAYAYAKTHGIDTIEGYGLALARHFVDDVDPVTGALIELEEYAWQRATVHGAEHDHTWVRSGAEVRTAAIVVEEGGAAQVTGGLKDLVLLKSTGSEFSGFLKDEYTTLPETTDRVMATSLVAQWRFTGTDLPWEAFYPVIRGILVREFATVHSLALQQTLWHMGRAVLEAVPEIAEITLSAPNKHHFAADLAPFGLTNENEVFFAADRPYGLIQATVLRDDAPPALSPWAFRAGPA
ncbi:factor-independent urate hydroxylase [Planctomonas psychrotolerans]|uniref:factor-independent urate hydroxylase n=1 Tax=Planctomonas psychrotolerans TaxID=2528712 RepID=UPI0012390AF3|nr:urate oxidase [Planctomonas psychrotolerans]